MNTTRGPYKINGQGGGITGFLIYNNTIVKTAGLDWGMIQNDNGALKNYSFRNNILIYRGTSGQTMAMDPYGQNPIDFTNNAWFPDGKFWWVNSGGSFNNLAAARAGLPAVSTVFGTTQRHVGDVITVSDPFVSPITLGSSHLTEYTGTPNVTLRTGTSPKNAGIVIPNITDGFTGAAPDIGAVIEGRAAIQYGATR